MNSNMNKTTTSNFDTPLWSTLIDEAATEHNHYQHEDNDHQASMILLFFFLINVFVFF